MPSIRVLLFVVVAFGATPAQAEHRSAILVGDNPVNLQAVAAGLERLGFYCRTIPTPKGERSVKELLEEFSMTTPVRGTSLVYFQGDAVQSYYTYDNGSKPSVNLLPAEANGRGGFSVRALCDALSSEGGCTQHLVVVDSPDPPEPPQELPSGCLVAFANAADWLRKVSESADLIGLLKQVGKTRSTLPEGSQLTGRGSPRVASADEFVEGQQAGDEWFNRRGIVFCWCPPGRYVAGSPADEPGRYPDEAQREVVIENGFWISKYELTRTQNLRDSRGRAPHSSIARHKLHPLTMVNLDDAKSMTARRFSAEERKAGRLPADWEYSMPAEEQWEYAARAGTQSAYCFGNDLSVLPEHGNFADKAFYDTADIYSNYADRTLRDGAERLAQVGSYKPNAWGLQDVHGNVAEWCLNTAVRGGSWVNTATDCRVAFRHQYGSRDEQNFIGYRIVIQKVSQPERKKK